VKRRRIAVTTAVATSAALLLPAGPAAAQQPVDATTQGGVAFVLFAVTVFAFAAIIFSMDRVRRRRRDDD